MNIRTFLTKSNVYLSVQQQPSMCMYGQDCVAETSVRLHISLHTRRGDLAAMRTLLAGDWLRARPHSEACAPTPTRSKFKLKKHSATRWTSQTLEDMCQANSIYSLNKCLWTESNRAAVKRSHVTFNWPLIWSHMLAAPTVLPPAGASLETKQFMICGVFPLFWPEGACPHVNCYALIPQVKTQRKSRPKKACRAWMSSVEKKYC